MTTAAPRLGLPPLFSHGRYEQVLISTFGADLEFYERVLRRHFGGYRNQIVLADSEMLRSAVAATTAGALRHVNRSWLAGPVRTKHAAHGKLILLAGPKAGLLLVGSGNLNISGYAGGGECFTPYHWSPEEPGHLNAFTTVRAMTDGLAARGYLDAATIERLGVFWSAQDWWHAPPTTDGPVRHNLDVPLGEQLIAELNGEPVEELVVAAPFHDPACSALEHLMTALTPQHTRVLVQPGRGSVDPSALSKVLSRHAAEAWSIEPVAVPVSTYLHAKVLLIKTARRAVCLTGSANCSQVALWRSHPDANVELGNLATGSRTAFDHLFAADVVMLAGPVDPATLGVKIQEESPTEPAPALRVENVRWIPPRLTGQLHGRLTDPAAVIIEIDGRISNAHVELSPGPAGTTTFTAVITDTDGLQALEGVVTVTVRVGDASSAATVPYQLERLREQDRRRVDIEQLRQAARMDLDDPDLQQALVALEEILVGDHTVRWTRDQDAAAGAEPEAEDSFLSWNDIDWDTVRAHPRFSAYQLGTQLGAVAGSDLAAYLAGLSQAVQELADAAPASKATPAAPTPAHGIADEDEDDDSDVDVDVAGGLEGADVDKVEEDEELVTSTRGVSYEARNLRVLRNFVRRNLRALESETFREQAGPGVVVPNLIILNWITWWVATKDPERLGELVDERLRLWTLLWGTAGTPGCLDGLDSDQRDLVRARLDEQRFHAVVIASFIGVWEVVELGDPRFRQLRELLRRALVDPLWSDDPKELVRAARLNNGRPGSSRHLDDAAALEIVWDITWRRLGEQEAARAIAAAAGVPATAIMFSVERARTGPSSGEQDVWQAAVEGEAPHLVAQDVLRAWLGVEDATCYRLKWSDGVALYAPGAGQGWVYTRSTDKTDDIVDLEPAYPPWAKVLEGVETTLPRRRRTVA